MRLISYRALGGGFLGINLSSTLTAVKSPERLVVHRILVLPR